MVPQHVDRVTFLANLRQSGLVDDIQLAALGDRLPATHRGRVVARTLVELGVLTKFQAERLLIGRTQGFFLGQYRILEQIGQGGMGRVFKAQHQSLGRTVALKVLSPDLLKDERAGQLFQREVMAAASLVHPNIVTAYDADRINERFFLAMEYIDGPTLDRLVYDQGPLPVGQACDFIRQVAEGLQCAFNIGIVHRDIKPGNLLLKKDGSQTLVKISDFGLARLHEKARLEDDEPQTIIVKANTIIGTPDFLSPEQARSIHKTDIRSDLYSLGCTFYYILTGKTPFAGGSSIEKLIRHCTEPPPPIEKLRPDVPAPIRAIISKLLAKEPEDRFQTPAELAQAVEPFAERGPLHWRSKAAASPTVDSNPVVETTSSDDWSALVGTVNASLGETPVPSASPILPANLKLNREYVRERRMWWIAGAVSALLAGTILLAAILQLR